MAARRPRATLPARRARAGARAALGVALGLAAAVASAQQGPPPTLADLALRWARGEFKSPLVCEVDGEPRRALRTLRIRTPRGPVREPTDELRFYPLPVPGCRSELGRPEPDVQGVLQFTHADRAHPDTAAHDFKEALQRDRGFQFQVSAGRLRIQDAPEAPPRELELEGGVLHLERVAEGTDVARLFHEYGRLPKRTLTLVAPDGTRLVFQLVQVPPR